MDEKGKVILKFEFYNFYKSDVNFIIRMKSRLTAKRVSYTETPAQKS